MEIQTAMDTLRCYRDAYEGEGLPEELFLFASTLVPLCNVDLLIRDAEGRYLLSWRNDSYFGQGWHLPGSCILFQESFAERIRACALSELGSEVLAEPEPCTVRYSFQTEERPGLSDPRERGHQISLLYRCRTLPGYAVDNVEKRQNEQGFLSWFDTLPENMLPQQEQIYGDIFAAIRSGLWK